MYTQRKFVQGVAASLCLPSAVLNGADGAASSLLAERPPRQPTGSDVGSLFPFIQSQAVRDEFPLSLLGPQFKSLTAWKRRARGKLLEMLQYAPPKCAARAEVVEQRDCGDYFREKVYFNTTPDLRIPAYVLLPPFGGGFRSCHLAALDDRIKAAVVVGWMTSFPTQLKKHIFNTIGHSMLVPGLYRTLDYPDVASLAMPSALLVINGSKDGLFAPDGVRAAFDKLTACYQKAGALEKLRLRLYDTPHEFNSEMQSEAWAWLKRWV